MPFAVRFEALATEEEDRISPRFEESMRKPWPTPRAPRCTCSRPAKIWMSSLRNWRRIGGVCQGLFAHTCDPLGYHQEVKKVLLKFPGGTTAWKLDAPHQKGDNSSKGSSMQNLN
jgi:hypothetical protein